MLSTYNSSRVRGPEMARPPSSLLWLLAMSATIGAGCDPPARDVVDAVAQLPALPREAVAGRLFSAANAIFAHGDARGALRVLALCRRLDPSSLDLELAIAEMECRVGNILGAHGGFRRVVARARLLCEDATRCTQNEQRDAHGLVVAGMSRHGMCLMEARRFGAAAGRFREALAIEPVLDGVAWHLGLACDYGGDWPGAVKAYLHWLRLQRTAVPPIKLARPASTTVVAIFCLHRTPDAPGGRWGSNSLEQRGIGGSEEAVIHVSRELAALGYHVEVYAYPPDSEVGMDRFGVWWLPVHWYGAIGLPSPHVFISWRAYALALQGGPSALNFLWLHDRVIPALAPEALVSQLSGVLLLSEHHKAQLPLHAMPKAILTRNGVAASFWLPAHDCANHPSHFIFASHPERGLEQLLHVWPQIKANVHGARLDIYHGFPDKYGEHGAPSLELEKMRAFRGRVEALLQDAEGVHMHGMVNQSTLAHAYARAGFWLYPISIAETSCISAMKAMGNGAIPITSRFPASGLVETTGAFDLGPMPLRPGRAFVDDAEMVTRWAEAVIDAAHRDARGELHDKRAAMVRWAREEYSWSAVASQWSSLFQGQRRV